MFKKSQTSSSPSLFAGISQHLNGRKIKQLEDSNAWHNCFYQEITSRIDENIFSPLYVSDNGRPNSSIRILVSMLILKAGNDWTDEQLFEACGFNILVSYALGLTNLSDSVPSPATYYNFKLALLEYEQEKGITLLEKCFQSLTKDQILRYEVSGASVRMDSKLIHSNVAKNTRLQLCIGVLAKFYKSLKEHSASLLSPSDKELLEEISSKSVEQYTYRLNKQSASKRLETFGALLFRLLDLYQDIESKEYALLKRLWQDHFELVEQDDTEENEPKPKDTKGQPGSTLQSAHDPDAAYRNKPGSKKQVITGFVCNITETCAVSPSIEEGKVAEKPLNLITDVQTEKATFSDDKFFMPAIENTRKLLQDEIANALTDGAYNSIINEQFSHFDEASFNWYLTAIQGAEGHYDFEQIDEQTYKVTDRRDGKVQTTVRTKKGKYRITENHAKQTYRYFEQKTITNYFRRKQMENYPQWVHALRANSEATIHQVFCQLNGMKSKYRGLSQHHQYALNRCFWTNFKRIQAKNIESERNLLIIALFTMVSTIKGLRRIFRNFFYQKLFDKILYCYFKERLLFRGF